MKRALFLILFSACGAIDASDGQADDPGDCCWFWPAEESVRQCVLESVDDWSIYEHDDEGCVPVHCYPATIDAIVKVCPE